MQSASVTLVFAWRTPPKDGFGAICRQAISTASSSLRYCRPLHEEGQMVLYSYCLHPKQLLTNQSKKSMKLRSSLAHFPKRIGFYLDAFFTALMV